MEDIESKFERLSDMYNEVVNENAKINEELEQYKLKVVPKYSIAHELFAIDIVKHDILKLKVDEIIIDKFGISYREYISETEFKQFPERFCFLNKIDANEYALNLEDK